MKEKKEKKEKKKRDSYFVFSGLGESEEDAFQKMHKKSGGKITREIFFNAKVVNLESEDGDIDLNDIPDIPDDILKEIEKLDKKKPFWFKK